MISKCFQIIFKKEKKSLNLLTFPTLTKINVEAQ